MEGGPVKRAGASALGEWSTAMNDTRRGRRQLAERIAGEGLHRWGAAAVLLHQAVADRLGLGSTDQQCLDLLAQHGAMTGSQLASITGLTTGAITGVVARLERGGFLRRDPHPDDGRKQVLSPVPERAGRVHEALHSLHTEVAQLLEGYDARQLTAIAAFLESSSELAFRHALRLRADGIVPAARGGEEH